MGRDHVRRVFMSCARRRAGPRATEAVRQLVAGASAGEVVTQRGHGRRSCMHAPTMWG